MGNLPTVILAWDDSRGLDADFSPPAEGAKHVTWSRLGFVGRHCRLSSLIVVIPAPLFFLPSHPFFTVVHGWFAGVMVVWVFCLFFTLIDSKCRVHFGRRCFYPIIWRGAVVVTVGRLHLAQFGRWRMLKAKSWRLARVLAGSRPLAIRQPS